MNLAGINDIVRDVFGPNTETKVINGWVSMRCPLAQWTHTTGRDSRASAGISIQENNTSVFNCMTCKTKVPLQGLIKKFAEFTGEDLDELIDELEDEAYLGPRSLAKWGERQDHNEDDPPVLNTELMLDLYDSAAGHRYLRKRGITADIAEKLQLKVDPRDPADGEERILFPAFNPEGELIGFSGRATNPRALLKVRDYGGFRKAKALLGAHLITQENPDKIIVVEGLFDYANAWQQGYPAVAVMHSTLTAYQARLLKNFSKPTYLFYDNDDAGMSGVDIAGKQLVRYMPVMKVRYPEVWIEDPKEEEGGHWLKDPGELLAEDFEGMINDARLF